MNKGRTVGIELAARVVAGSETEKQYASCMHCWTGGALGS